MQNGRERHGKCVVWVDLGFGVMLGGGTKIIDFLYNLRSTVPLYHGGVEGWVRNLKFLT